MHIKTRIYREAYRNDHTPFRDYVLHVVDHAVGVTKCAHANSSSHRKWTLRGYLEIVELPVGRCIAKSRSDFSLAERSSVRTTSFKVLELFMKNDQARFSVLPWCSPFTSSSDTSICQCPVSSSEHAISSINNRKEINYAHRVYLHRVIGLKF